MPSTYEVDGITHYCVANMPGAVPITSTYALTNATLPYVMELAERGVAEALESSMELRSGLNVKDGEITHPAVAEALDTAVAADPQISFAVFKHRRYGLARPSFSVVQRRTASIVEPQQAAGIGTHPDVSVAVLDQRQNLKALKGCRYAGRGESAAVPSHQAAIRANP